MNTGACPGAPPPLEIEKQKKKVIRANIKLFHLYFATFLVENIIFSASFWAGPPPEKLKSKKKFLDTRLEQFRYNLHRVRVYFLCFHDKFINN